MPLPADELTRIIEAAFPGADIRLEDLAGDGDHYRLTLTAEAFRGKSRIEQHRLVMNALKGTKAHDLHALALATGVPK